ncbi:hypothetical protein J3E64_003661 [Sphingobium sp. OAS761]|uniref:LPD7 domain-containing protein n=1 Tax=Sphingobium sp. OAS761 TaxID=2817901 RepID=UPI00209F80E0|nr:LPD7 domain-containing protein [Sphingobium sp. OAS761]MCP1471946.1 hypothetical protein [Sphingobium sp. OAS761]
MAADKPKGRTPRAKENTIGIDRGKAPPAAGRIPPDDGKTNPSADDRTRSPIKKAEKIHSVESGDVPEALRKRYFSSTSRWSGEPAFFTTAQATEPAFRDQGRRLITSSESEEVVKDLVAIARHRGWSQIHVTGTEPFRRAAWLEASRQGLEVRGYRPAERDLQELDRMRRDASRNSVSPALEGRSTEPNRSTTAPGISHPGLSRDRARDERAAQSQLRVIEAVVRTALFDDPAAIGRVMKVAQAKMDQNLSAGREIRPALVRQANDRQRTGGREHATKAKTPPQRARNR